MPRANRKVMTGYPKFFIFQTREHIDAYFMGDKITCLQCGKQYRILDTHLRAQHGMTSDDYRTMYGIPANRGLCGSERTDRSRLRMLTYFEDNPDEKERRREQVNANRHLTVGKSYRRKPAYWKAERTKYTEEMWKDVGRLMIGGMCLCDAAKQVGVGYTLLRYAKRRWPDFAAWWEKEVNPIKISAKGRSLTASARAARAAEKSAAYVKN